MTPSAHLTRPMQLALEKLRDLGSFKINDLPKPVMTRTMLALYRRGLVRYQNAHWWPVENPRR